ncbi:PPE domain-containing protein [Parasphingorhabdus pacifica]
MGFTDTMSDIGGAVTDAAGAVTDSVTDAAGAVVDAGRDVGAGLFGWESTAEKEARERAERAEQQGEAERAELASENRQLESDIQGYDPASISTCENWAAYGHQELYERNQKLDEGTANETAQAWKELGSSLADLGGRYSKDLRQKIQGGWEGEAAEAAASVGDPLSKWMTNSSSAFELTGNRIKEAASAAGQSKASVPEPEGHNYARSFGTTLAGGPILGGKDAIAQMQERQEAERAAQETMGRVLGATYQNVDTQVPAYQDLENKPVAPPEPPPPSNVPPPPPPVNPGGGGVSPSGIGGGGVGGGGTGGAGTGGIGGGGAGGSGGTGPGGSGIGSGIGSGTGGSGTNGPDDPAGTDSAWTPSPGGSGPGGVPSPGAGAGAGGGAAGGGVGAGVGMVPGGAGGGAGGAAGGRGAGSLAAGGRAGTGGVGAGGAAGSGTGGGAAAGGRTGAGGGRGAMGGMGAGGRGGQGGEEPEHERPSWLEEQDDIWMDDMPKTAPPVFGG